jgi:hypothetical protein
MNAGVVGTCTRRLCTTLRFPRSPALNKRGAAATSGLKASAPKLKNGAMAVRHWMILQGEIAFGQIGNGDIPNLLAEAKHDMILAFSFVGKGNLICPR